jgi:DNA repair protein RadC
VRRYLSLQLSGLTHELFAALFLDNRHRVIEYKELFTGTIDSAAVYPREVVKHCLNSNAAAVIFAHNHPSGVAEPSDTDVRLTRKLTDALALIDVRVLDHLVIGQGVQTSMAEQGLL